MSEVLSAAELKAIERRTVEVSAFGGTVLVRQLGLNDVLHADTDSPDMTAELIAKSLVDAEGNRLFGDDDLDVVRNLPYEDCAKLFAAICDLNPSLREQAIDDAAKN